MLYIREDIPSNLLATDKEHIESLYVELNLRNEKYLINCSYNPHKTMIKNHLATLSNFLDLHSSKYKKMLILGDFNIEIDEPHMKSFCETYNLTNLIKQPICYKNPVHWSDPNWCSTYISKYLCNWDRAIGFSFNDIDYYEKNFQKTEA